MESVFKSVVMEASISKTPNKKAFYNESKKAEFYSAFFLLCDPYKSLKICGHLIDILVPTSIIHQSIRLTGLEKYVQDKEGNHYQDYNLLPYTLSLKFLITGLSLVFIMMVRDLGHFLYPLL